MRIHWQWQTVKPVLWYISVSCLGGGPCLRTEEVSNQGGMPSIVGCTYLKGEIGDVWSSDVQARVPRLRAVCAAESDRLLSRRCVVVVTLWYVGAAVLGQSRVISVFSTTDPPL